jgi:hypothetical protein
MLADCKNGGTIRTSRCNEEQNMTVLHEGISNDTDDKYWTYEEFIAEERSLNMPLARRIGGPLIRPIRVANRVYRVMADLEVPPDPTDPLDWENGALCRQIPHELFFTDDVELADMTGPEKKLTGYVKGGLNKMAERACGLCEVSVQCLAAAEPIRDGHGVRGAMAPKERGTFKRQELESESIIS